MRKWLKTLLLAGVFTLLLCGSALAAGERGICDVSSQSGTILTPQTASQGTPSTQVVNGKTVYLNAVRVAMTYSGAEVGKEYLVFVLEDGTTPTADNIVYIDQKSGTAAGTFDLYPSRLASGKTYNVFVSSSSDGLTKVGSFGYYADYMLGDVDGNSKITANDASCVLMIAVGKGTWTEAQRLAADADRNGKITANDASVILRVVVGKDTLD